MKRIALMIFVAIIYAGGGVFAEEITSADYTVITPDGLTITQNGWNPSTGITASSDRWIKITVTASTDSVLTSEHGHVIPYVLTSRDGGSAVTKWEFSMEELHAPGGTTKPVGAMIDLSTARPGSYTTNLIYIVSAERAPVDLAQITGDYEAQDGDILTGTAGADVHITVAAGATITLRSADITSIPDNNSHKWAGITCSGDATIILSGDNTVKGGNRYYPGIFAAVNSTLTIKGTGSLTASSGGSGSNYNGAGIGGGYQIACGNIEIQGGNITATGGTYAAGIGSGGLVSCGTISISGGNVTATGGMRAAGIGSGSYYASCRTITITGGTIKATGGSSESSEGGAGIGSGGYESSCGNIVIEGGNITANGGSNAAGIGAGNTSTCEDITISGGEITATGVAYAAGIGSGQAASCGKITIANTVTSVTAIRGSNSTLDSIGRGTDNKGCGVITIGRTEYWDGSAYQNGGDNILATSPYTYQPQP